MAKIINFPRFKDTRGSLAVIEKIAGFEIRRVYFIYQTNGEPRGAHRHKQTKQILVAVSGACKVKCSNGKTQASYLLNDPSMGLIVEASDWHEMTDFSDNCVLVILANKEYDREDYIYDEY